MMKFVVDWMIEFARGRGLKVKHLQQLVLGLALVAPLCLLAISRAADKVPSLYEINSQDDLNKTMASLDKALFDSFNNRDYEKLADFFTSDIEFYHDQAPVTAKKDDLVRNFKKLLSTDDIIRELVPGTLQAFHMKDYGAIEIGVHRFNHPKTKIPSGEGRFIHLWQFKDGEWKIARAISYDHHEAKK